MEELFERGLGKTHQERMALIRESGEDAEVARQLEELWENANPPSSFLRGPAADAAAIVGTASLTRLLRPGDTVAGRFVVVELIGAGGMGEVYRARDERLQRIVALKVLPERLAADAGHRKRLEHEARAVSSLSHPRICALHDFGADGDCLYLVMEYLRGETLDAKLRAGPVPESEAVAIALEICEGLRHAHENGLIHRDLKPGNVMLGPSGAKLLDFGIAARALPQSIELAEQTTLEGLTSAGQIVGTPAYMSPEQASGLTVDTRSDIFALGAVLFEMITGRRAFPRGPFIDPIPPMPAVSSEGDPPPSAALREIVTRCLRKAPEQRYASVAHLELALRESKQPAATRSRRKRAIRKWLGAGAASACVAAAAIWFAHAGISAAGEPRLTSLTAYPGTEYHPSLSPDGRNVAFLWDGDGDNFDVYVQPIGSDRPLRLTTDPASEKWPQWSPDGRWIAFTRDKNILLISPFGGAERVVAQTAAVNPGCDIQFNWTGDSVHIVFAGPAAAAGEAPGLQAVSVETGVVRAITRPDRSTGGDWCPAVSLDGKRIFYTHRMPLKADADNHHVAWLRPDLTLAGDRQVPWVKGWSHAWAADGHEMIHAVSLPAGAFLFRTSVEQSSERRQLPFGEEGMYPAVSRTGNRMVYMRRKSDIDILGVGLKPDGTRTEPVKIVRSSRIDTVAEYSPDGSRIAFVSERDGRPGLWVARSDGASPKRIASAVRGGLGADVPRWSPDGKRILCVVDKTIVAIDPESGNTQRVAGGSANARAPGYSRDGRWIYFSSDRGEESQIWRMPAGGGEAQQITTSGGYGGIESFDGRDLFFLRGRDNRSDLFVMPANGGTERHIATTIPGRMNLASTERGLYFVSGGDADRQSVISLYRPDTRVITKVVELPTKQRWMSSGLSVSPDHRRFLYSAYDFQADLMLVDNFR